MAFKDRILLRGFTLLLSMALAGCIKPSNDTTATLMINLPAPTSNQNSQINNTTQSTSFGVPTPTAFGAINCFFVFVAGPESQMSGNSCSVGTPATVIPVGLVAGSIAGGGSLSVEVPSGPNRSIGLVGMKTDGSIDCPNLQNFNSLSGHFSNPVLLGRVNGISMSPGTTVSVNVPVTSTINPTTQSIGTCSGPVFNNGGSGGGGGNGPPAGFKISLQDNLTSFNAGSCVPVIFQVVDSAGNGANMGGATVTGNYSYTAGGGPTLFSQEQCTSGSISSLSFNGYNTILAYALMPSAVSTGLTLTGTGLTSATKSITVVTASTATKLALVDIINATTLVDTASVPAFSCRSVILQGQDASGLPATFSGTNSNASASGVSNMGFYTDPGCTSWYGSTIPMGPNSFSNSVTSSVIFGFRGLTTSTASLTNITKNTSPSVTSGAISYSMVNTTAAPTQIGVTSKPGSGGKFTDTTIGVADNQCTLMEAAFIDSSGNRNSVTGGTTVTISSNLAILYGSMGCSSGSTSMGPLTVESHTNGHVIFYVKASVGTTPTLDITSSISISSPTITINPQ